MAVFLCIFAVYIHNLCQTTYGGDVGDLLAASVTAGVAHPPGYPFFTLIGFLLSRINFISPAFMVGLISVFSGALGIFFFYLFSYKFTKSKIISLISVLILAFSYYYWFYSEIGEVFALNNFFAILLLFLAFSYNQNKQKKYLYLLSFSAGLSLTNHQTILLIFPSLLVLIIRNLMRSKQRIKVILSCLGFFIIGLLPYIYIPIAASHNPPVNWDNVHDLNSFLRLILRKDYGTFSIGHIGASSFAQKIVTVKIYLSGIITQATLPAITIVLLGMVYAFKKHKEVFYSLFLAFLLSGPVFLSYAGFSLLSPFLIGVYERFTILSFVTLLMFLPFGLLFIKKILEKFLTKKEFSFVILCVFLIIPLLLFKFNFLKTDLHDLKLGENLIHDILSPLPLKSVIFLDGDTIIFNDWYVKYVEKFRPDIEVIDTNGPATNNNFYQSEAKKYYKQHPKEKKSLNAGVKVLAQIAKIRNVYSSLGMQTPDGFSWVAYGLVYKLVAKKDLPSEADYINQTNKISWQLSGLFEKRTLAEGNLTVSDIYSYYSQAFLRVGQYFDSPYKDSSRAIEYYSKAVRIDPQNPSAYQVIGSYYVLKGNCSKAESNLRKAINLAPYQNLVYFLLYYDYEGCFKSPKKANQLVLEYQKNFQSNFVSDFKKYDKSNKNK